MSPERGDDGFDAVRRALDWWAEQPVDGAWPTSSLTGGGAIAALEYELADCLGGYALALPSGTSAMRTALRVLYATDGARVRLADHDWFGGSAVVASVGALAVTGCSDVDVVIRSTHDGWSDHHERLRTPVVVDAADLDPTDYRTWRHRRWTALALSFGPGKPIDAGEGGALLVRTRVDGDAAVALTQHPIRHRLAGIEVCRTVPAMERIHPVAALVALHALARRPSPPTPSDGRVT